MAAWHSVHAAYRGVVRERWLATQRGLLRRRAKSTTGDGANTVPLSRTTVTAAPQIRLNLSTIKLAVGSLTSPMVFVKRMNS